MRQALIYRGEDGYWVAECPSLPGCISQGKTKQEAITNIREAIEGYIVSLEEDGLAVPGEQFSRVSRLPRISGRDCVNDWAKLDQKRQHGSHIILRRDDPFAQVVIPDHRELDRGTCVVSSERVAVDG